MKETYLGDLTGRAEFCRKVNTKGEACLLRPGHKGECDFGEKEDLAAASNEPAKSKHDIRGIDSKLDPDDEAA